MHKQCMVKQQVGADHTCFSSLPGRPVWPQLPGDVPECPGLQGAELLPAGPLRLLLRLGLERLPLQPRYGDVVSIALPIQTGFPLGPVQTSPGLRVGLGWAVLLPACSLCLHSSMLCQPHAMARSSREFSSNSLSPGILRP